MTYDTNAVCRLHTVDKCPSCNKTNDDNLVVVCSNCGRHWSQLQNGTYYFKVTQTPTQFLVEVFNNPTHSGEPVQSWVYEK